MSCDYTSPESDVWPDGSPRPQDFGLWMNQKDKMPFAPWGEADHPAKDTDARYSWGLPSNYGSFETAREWARMDPSLGDGLAFISQKRDDPYGDEADPFLMVDGDDVRCPETGEVHPEFVSLVEKLSARPEGTYQDISTSGGGAHAYFVGELPEGHKALDWEIDDEAWGAHDEGDTPHVEIYDGKRQFIMTGKHVPGSPLSINEVDRVELKALADEHGTEKSRTSAGEEYDPDERGTLEERRSALGNDTTEDWDEFMDAVWSLTASDVRLRSTMTEARADGESWDPKFVGEKSSESGTRLWYYGDGGWNYRQGDIGLATIEVIACEEGIISPGDRLRGQDLFDAIEVARKRGAPIPEYEPPEGEGFTPAEYDPHDHVFLPETRETQSAAAGWSWMGEQEADISQEDLWEMTGDVIDDAMSRGDNILVNAIMSAGKSYNALRVLAERGEKGIYLTEREDLYQQAYDWGCEMFGEENVKVLPRFPADCDTYNGEYGEEAEDRAKAMYGMGATPDVIHSHGDVPCMADDTPKCAYKAKWEGDLDDYDLLIGHYKQSYNDLVTKSRHVIFDEFPRESLWQHFSDYDEEKPDLTTNVTRFCRTHEEFPFEDYHDIIENRRSDPERLREAQAWFDGYDFTPDQTAAVSMRHHAHAGHATYTILFGSLGSDDYDIDRANIPTDDTDRHTGVFFRGGEWVGPQVALQHPPDLNYTTHRAILALDGTPVKSAWETALGKRLEERQVLPDHKRTEYVRDTLGQIGVPLTEHVKPYSSGEYVTLPKDAAWFEGWKNQYGEPVVFTTLAAENKYKQAGLSVDDGGPVKDFGHFGALKGENKYKSERSAIVSGSSHYGDTWVKIMAGMEGIVVDPEGKGVDRDYGEAEEYVRLMDEAEVVQAAMRVGRDGNGAVVGFNTCRYPDWFPTAEPGEMVRTYTDKQASVVRILEHLFEIQDTVTAGDVLEHPDCLYDTRAGVRKTLKSFDQQGFLDGELDGRQYVWADDGIHLLNERGEMELPAIDPESLGGEDTEHEHTIYYMPSFGVTPPESVDAITPTGETSLKRQELAVATIEDGPPPE